MKLKNLENESMIKYFEYAKNIGDLLLNSLNNQLLFKQKLEILQVTVNQSVNGNTNAFLIKKNEKFELLLVVNPNEHEVNIKFIIAHEFSHLLFAICNQLRISGYCSTDDSFDVTSVKRISNGEEYGNAMEELLCDYIALELLHEEYKAKYTREKLLDIAYSGKRGLHLKENFYLVLDILKLFGNLYSNKFDALLEENAGSASPENLLMYTVVTDTLNVLVNEYDTLMGKGAWKKFNHCFEKFVSQHNDDAKKIIDIEMKRFSMM